MKTETGTEREERLSVFFGVYRYRQIWSWNGDIPKENRADMRRRLLGLADLWTEDLERYRDGAALRLVIGDVMLTSTVGATDQTMGYEHAGVSLAVLTVRNMALSALKFGEARGWHTPQQELVASCRDCGANVTGATAEHWGGYCSDCGRGRLMDCLP